MPGDAGFGALQALKDAGEFLPLFRQDALPLPGFRLGRLEQAMPLGVLALPVCAFRLHPSDATARCRNRKPVA
jgi:hypothetical protein